MTTLLKNLFYLLGVNRKWAIGIIGLFVVLSSLDLAGLSLIGPYVILLSGETSNAGAWLIKVLGLVGLNGNTREIVVSIGCILVGIFLVKAVVATLINYIVLKYTWRQLVTIRKRLLETYQTIPYELYTQKNSSDYIQVTEKYAFQYSGALTICLQLASEGIIGVVILSFLAYSEPFSFAILFSLMVCATFLYDRVTRNQIEKAGRSTNESLLAALKGIQETIFGFKVIRTLGREAYFNNRVHEASLSASKSIIKSQIFQIIPRYLFEMLAISFIVLLVTIGIFMEEESSELFATATVFGIAAVRLMPTANQFSNGFARLRFFQHGISVIRDDLSGRAQNVENKFNTSATHSYKDKKLLALELKDLDFKYMNANTHVLEKASLVIKKGQITGIVGPSGSGKTTLIDLMLGFHEPTDGDVIPHYSDGTTSTTEYRTLAAYLPQEAFITDDTVARNVALGLDEIDIDETKVRSALDRAHLLEFVNTLPNGIYTNIGERGMRISGGQRQRLSLARAFYLDKQILVMDEATNALDSDLEAEILQQLIEIKKDYLIVIVGHQESTLKLCDIIYKVENRVAMVNSNIES